MVINNNQEHKQIEKMRFFHRAVENSPRNYKQIEDISTDKASNPQFMSPTLLNLVLVLQL
jgi:hypothetical protein